MHIIMFGNDYLIAVVDAAPWHNHVRVYMKLLCFPTAITLVFNPNLCIIQSFSVSAEVRIRIFSISFLLRLTKSNRICDKVITTWRCGTRSIFSFIRAAHFSVSRQPHDGQKRFLQLWLISHISPQSGLAYMSIPKAVVRHTRITFTALYCSKVMYSVGCYVYSSHYRLKKSDKRYFFVLQPSVYISFNKSVILVSLFPLFFC